MRIKGDNGLVFDVADTVATAMIAAGHVTEVTSHRADPATVPETDPATVPEPKTEGPKRGSKAGKA